MHFSLSVKNPKSLRNTNHWEAHLRFKWKVVKSIINGGSRLTFTFDLVHTFNRCCLLAWFDPNVKRYCFISSRVYLANVLYLNILKYKRKLKPSGMSDNIKYIIYVLCSVHVDHLQKTEQNNRINLFCGHYFNIIIKPMEI